MKNSMGIAVITFIVALGVGLFKNPNWMIAIFRAIFSALIALAANAIILSLIQRFIPELLLNPQQESEEDLPFGSLNKDALHENSNENVGQSVNIVLDENNNTSASSSLGQSPVSYSGSENFSTTNFSSPSSFSLSGGSSSDEDSSTEEKKQMFLREDPSILAKMVRTRLNDED